VSDAQHPLVRGHDAAHRRGLVMGLTMAEIMLMILFMLLLILGILVAKRDSIIHRQQKRLVELEVLDQYVADVLKSTDGRVTVTDIIRQIRRDQREVRKLKNAIAKLEPLAASGKAIDDIVREIKRQGGLATPAEIAKRLQSYEALSHENGTLKGQVSQLTKQIKAAGRGNEFPSCWVTPAGEIESIFELVLSPKGIVIENHAPADRLGDEAALPLKKVTYDLPLGTDQFVAQMRPLYRWSIAHQCRFYVIRYSTIPSAPIPDVNAISDLFYPDSRIIYDRTHL